MPRVVSVNDLKQDSKIVFTKCLKVIKINLPLQPETRASPEAHSGLHIKKTCDVTLNSRSISTAAELEFAKK